MDDRWMVGWLTKKKDHYMENIFHLVMGYVVRGERSWKAMKPTNKDGERKTNQPIRYESSGALLWNLLGNSAVILWGLLNVSFILCYFAMFFAFNLWYQSSAGQLCLVFVFKMFALHSVLLCFHALRVLRVIWSPLLARQRDDAAV